MNAFTDSQNRRQLLPTLTDCWSRTHLAKLIAISLVVGSLMLTTACSQQPAKALMSEEQMSAQQAFIASLPADPYWQQEYSAISADIKTDYQTALTLLEQQQWQQAKRQMLKLHKNAPKLSAPLLQLAIIAKHQNNIEEVKTYTDKAIAANRYCYEAYMLQALMAREQGKFQQAQQYYQDILHVWPGYADAYYNLGILNDLYLGNKQQAYEHYQTYLMIAGDDKTVAAWVQDIERQMQ